MSIGTKIFSEGEKLKVAFTIPDISQLEIEEVVRVMQSGWITSGPEVKKLENLLSSYIGTQKTCCLNSQTAAGEMSLRLLGIGADAGGSESDEVITCAYTYTATASVIDHVKAKIVLIDCCEDSLEMNYDALEAAINENTKAVIPIDLGGIPCNYDRLFDIVESKKHLFRPSNSLQETIGRVAIVADAAHALGAKARFRGKWEMVGNIADISNFSFHAVKNFTTAEGGAITWNIKGADSEEIFKYLKLYSMHGQSKDALAKDMFGDWEYDIVSPAYKCNMTDVAAAMGVAQFKRYPEMLKRRREVIEKYDNAFRPIGIDTLKHYTDNHISSGHLYIARVPGINGETRNRIINEMAEQGVMCNVHYKPLPMMTAYKNMGFDIKDYPCSYKRFINAITLPLHTRLTDEEVDYSIQMFLDILKDIVK